jgi:hypothetical protein
MKNLIRKILKEELDSDWGWSEEAKTITVDSIKRLLSDCSDLPYMIYKVEEDGGWISTSRGKPTVYHLSTCDYWVDRFPDNEWIVDDSEAIKRGDKVLIISTYGRHNNLDRENFNLDNGFIIHQDIGRITANFDGSSLDRSSEYPFFVDNNGEPIWDLILPEYREGIRDSLKRLNTPV